jgi:phosphatidylserine/phosphatidylglycerophosphate/cardiolipin synthase-like enzyme
MATTLRAAAKVETYHRQHEQLELVWSGPDTQLIPLRRTAQALRQLIDEADEQLHIVSFAVYKIGAIRDALIRAATRGVAICIYLETPGASQDKITYDTIKALGQDVARRSTIYVWPLQRRRQTPDGKHGSLHAKIAVADSQRLLISSANLTEYAMKLNMEMGVLIRGGPLPAQVAEHLERLVDDGVFQEA